MIFRIFFIVARSFPMKNMEQEEEEEKERQEGMQRRHSPVNH